MLSVQAAVGNGDGTFQLRDLKQAFADMHAGINAKGVFVFD